MNDKSFPKRISLETEILSQLSVTFRKAWLDMMQKECHGHQIWQSSFISNLKTSDNKTKFQLAATWATNMVVGSFCFPRYVAALAARSEYEVIRYGLLENAWDESGGYSHASRSHFWLAVRLAKLLGLKDGETSSIQPLSQAINYTDKHYKQCLEGDFGFGLGMLCLIEEFTTPEFSLIFQSLLSSVHNNLNMSSEAFILQGGAEYFTANISDDERHKEEMPRLVAALLKQQGFDLDSLDQTNQGLEPIRRGIQNSINLREKFFDGINDFVSRGMGYRDLIHKENVN